MTIDYAAVDDASAPDTPPDRLLEMLDPPCDALAYAALRNPALDSAAAQAKVLSTFALEGSSDALRGCAMLIGADLHTPAFCERAIALAESTKGVSTKSLAQAIASRPVDPGEPTWQWLMDQAKRTASLRFQLAKNPCLPIDHALAMLTKLRKDGIRELRARAPEELVTNLIAGSPHPDVMAWAVVAGEADHRLRTRIADICATRGAWRTMDANDPRRVELARIAAHAALRDLEARAALDLPVTFHLNDDARPANRLAAEAPAIVAQELTRQLADGGRRAPLLAAAYHGASLRIAKRDDLSSGAIEALIADDPIVRQRYVAQHPTTPLAMINDERLLQVQLPETARREVEFQLTHADVPHLVAALETATVADGQLTIALSADDAAQLALLLERVALLDQQYAVTVAVVHAALQLLPQQELALAAPAAIDL